MADIKNIDKDIDMNAQEKELVKEAIELLDKGLMLLSSVNGNAKVALLAKLVHGAISVGEMML